MPVTIELKDIPDAMYQLLETRAGAAGMSVSDYLLRDVRRDAELPTMKEWVAKLKEMKPIITKETAAEAIRAIRGE
jgi:hypothetical protein